MLQQQERRKETYNGMNRLMEEKQAKECNVIHIRRKKEMKQTFGRKKLTHRRWYKGMKQTHIIKNRYKESNIKGLYRHTEERKIKI